MNPWTHVVGWTLIHFVWQGAALALITAGVLRLSRHRSANARYTVACVGLAAMLAFPVMTARVLMLPDSAFASVAALSQTVPAAPTVAAAWGGWTYDGALSIQTVGAGLDPFLPAVVLVWLTGVALLLVRMAGGLWHVHRLQLRSLSADASRWQAAADRLASRLGLRVAVHVVESALIDTPAAVGWLRPVILLPVAALTNLTLSQVEAILAHELVHIRRHDYLVNVAQTVAETLLFFHPAVWWVSAQIRAEREHCCDDVAVQVCGDRVDYATALAELEAWRSSGTALALAAVGGSLTGRVRRLLNVPAERERRSLSWVVTLGLTLVFAVVTGGMYAASYGAPSGIPDSTGGTAQQLEPIASPDTFDWQIRSTSHFDIYYYAALAPRLEQVADSAERAYQRISSELKYDLAFRVPLIPFRTRSDFEQQGMVPEVRELIARGDVTSFSEPKRNRVVVLLDQQPDRWYRQITHELTHIFAFDIIPRSATNPRRVPPWIDEGFAEYMTGEWDPGFLNEVRDLVVTERVPRMSALEGDAQSHRTAAHVGHAVFEFIDAEFGKPAVWQFLLAVRREVVDGGGDVYRAAFNRTPEEFDLAFAEYLRRRFNR